MLQKCLRNSLKHHNPKYLSKNLHHSTFSPIYANRASTFRILASVKSRPTSHTSNLSYSLVNRGTLGTVTARRNSSTGTANAAYAAEQAAKDSRQQQIIKLVEKKVRLREQLLEESLSSQDNSGNNTTESTSVNHLTKIQISKLLKDLEPLLEPWARYNTLVSSLESTAPLLKDADESIRSLAEDETVSIKAEMSELIEGLKTLLLKREMSGMENVGALVEIKAGAGGEEAGLFAGELMRMYHRYADIWGEEVFARGIDEESMGSRGRGGWKITTISETVSTTSTGKTGFKEIVFEVKGRGAYETFRWENGVHRVQRVPLTETSGRLHTSAVAVVVLPVTEEDGGGANDDVNSFYVDEKEVKVEVMRARGAGGQHVNKTESAVRLTHIPTGINVSMQDSRSQHTNKQYAWKILRSRLFDLKLRQDAERNRDTKRALIKGMDRSDKIRTYNFVQDRVTDHRTGYTTMNLDSVLDGEGLEAIIEACRRRHEEEVMAGLLEE